MRIAYVALSILILSALLNGRSEASECIEALKVIPELKESDFTSKDFYFQHRIWSSTSASETDQKGDKELGLSIAGFGLTTSDKSHIRSKLLQSAHEDTTIVANSERRLIIYNSSAQSKALDKWSDCMALQSGGILVRLEPQIQDTTGTLVKLKIPYYVPPGAGPGLYKDVKLAASANRALDAAGVKYDDPEGCLTNHTYNPTENICDIALQVPSRRTQFDLTMLFRNADNIGFSASAYLPPRPILKWEVRDWPAVKTDGDSCGDNLKNPRAACAQADNRGHGRTNYQTRKADAGFVFIKESIHCDLVPSRLDDADCQTHLNNTGDEIKIEVGTGQIKGPPEDAYWANGHVTAKEIRPYWDWGIPPPPPPPRRIKW